MFTFENGNIYDSKKNLISTMGILYDADGYILLSVGEESIIKTKYEALQLTAARLQCGIKPVMLSITVTAENGKQLCEDINHMFECTRYIEQWLKKLAA